MSVSRGTDISGVMVALVTPVEETGGIDLCGLERLMERVVAGGVDGISPVGSTGEGPKLTSGQRVSLVSRVRALVPAGMPVVPGMPLVTVAEALAEIQSLAEADATAVMVSPPSYYPLADDAVLRLYETVADRSPLPLLLYNIPAFTKVRIAPEVVAALATHPNVVGLKDSSRDLEYQQQVLRACAGAAFSVLTGTDSLLVASLVIGARGAIAASANLAPELAVGVYRAFAAGDVPAALRRQDQLSAVVAACRCGDFPAGWKAALELRGVCGADPVPPGSPLSAAQHADLEARLATAFPAEDVTR